MAQKCENCGIHIQRLFTHTDSIVRQDPATGYTYKFCSGECANQWVQKRKQPPPPAQDSTSLQSEESRQIEQRWVADGGADRSAQR
jgi:hypothetical protein